MLQRLVWWLGSSDMAPSVGFLCSPWAWCPASKCGNRCLGLWPSGEVGVWWWWRRLQQVLQELAAYGCTAAVQVEISWA